MVGPDHCDPGGPVNEYWNYANAEGVSEDWADVSQWWYQFGDDSLNLLIEEAAAQNLTLEEAAHRVLEARYQRGVVRADLFPQFEGTGDYTFTKTPISGGFFSQLGPAANFIDTTIDNFTLGVNGGWDIDVWGRLRRNVEAAEADIGAAVWAYRDTMVILTADVATFYVDARGFQRRIEVAKTNIERQRRSVEIAEQRFEAGLTDDLAVQQTRANYYSSLSEIPNLEVGYQQSINRLSVLLGRPPGYVDELLSQPAPIPRPPADIAVGIPADLLRRRPDVRQAERALAAQTARIGVAVADLYPQFTISGGFGVTAQRPAEMFTFNGFQANVGPAMNWNILNFGRIRFNINVQEERAIQNLLQYENSVLLAAEEVDNALAAYDGELKRRVSLKDAVDAYRRAEELVEKQEQAGTVDEQRLIDIQRELFRFEDQWVASQALVSRNVISLYRALGGGWEWSTGSSSVQGVIEEFPEIEEMPDGEFPDGTIPDGGAPNELVPIPEDGIVPIPEGQPQVYLDDGSELRNIAERSAQISRSTHAVRNANYSGLGRPAFDQSTPAQELPFTPARDVFVDEQPQAGQPQAGLPVRDRRPVAGAPQYFQEAVGQEPTPAQRVASEPIPPRR